MKMDQGEQSTQLNEDLSGIGYAEALAELDKILKELDSSEVDVDQLAHRVARAHQLIDVCRQRIEAARLQIQGLSGTESAG
jgi:exodeoxyribonuclease VII small subunit